MEKNRFDLCHHEHMPWGYPASFPREARNLSRGKLTYSMIRDAWQQKGDQNALLRLKARFPLRSIWLFREFEYIDPEKEMELIPPQR